MRIRKGRSKRSGMSMIVITVLVLFVIITYKKIIDTPLEKILQKQLEDLNEEKDNLDAYKEYVYSDDNIERIARERLGLVYPNEIVFEAEDD